MVDLLKLLRTLVVKHYGFTVKMTKCTVFGISLIILRLLFYTGVIQVAHRPSTQAKSTKRRQLYGGIRGYSEFL